MAVPDLRRGHRRRRKGLATASSWCAATSRWTSSCPTSPGSRCWPSCPMDVAALAQRTRLSLGSGRRGTVMSRISVRNVWKEYGDQVVLERLDAGDRVRRVLSPWSARRAAARPRSCACCWARRARPAARSSSTASRWRPSPARDRGVVFQRYSVFPHLTVLQNVMLGREFAAVALPGQAVRREAPRRRGRGGGDAEAKSAWPPTATKYPRSFRAACSSGWRSRRR